MTFVARRPDAPADPLGSPRRHRGGPSPMPPWKKKGSLKDRVEADQVAVKETMAEGTVEVRWFFALTAEGAGHVLATRKKCSFFNS